MSDSQSPVLLGLAALREECVARLEEESDDYRALRALDVAIAELTSRSSVKTGMSSNGRKLFAQPRPEASNRPPSLQHAISRMMDRKAVSQADAAVAIIEAHGPTTIANLVPLVRQAGAQVAGNDPQTNLSSSLSRDGRFQSVRIEGVAHWALKDDPAANGGTEGDETPNFPGDVFK